jgi:hypothetical protein
MGAVVRNQIDDHPQPLTVRGAQHLLERRQVAEQGIHVAVIADVVTVVGLRRALERCDPHRLDAQLRQVTQACGDPRQVAHTIAVAVRERARVNLVNDRVTPPAAHRTPPHRIRGALS